MIKIKMGLTVVSALYLLFLSAASLATEKIISTTVQGHFAEVSANVRASIIGKGIHIAHVLPASAMLQRTGQAYGYTDNVYQHAEIYEFCSAKLSHQLSRLDPANIMLCPFTISVYVLTSDPTNVNIAYRIPQGKPGSENVVEEIKALMESIVEDATW